MTEKLNVAIIGCGGISRGHLPNLLRTPTLRLIATMDLVEEAARERAEQGSAQYWTTDYDRVLADDEIDAVVICSTHSTHTDLTLQALSAGKHVYVEKPPSMTVDEAKSVQKASLETGLHVMSGWWFKHSADHQAAPGGHQGARASFSSPAAYLIETCGRGNCTRPTLTRPTASSTSPGTTLHFVWHVMRSQPVEVTAMGLDGGANNTSSILIQFENGGLADSITSLRGRRRHHPEALCRGRRGQRERGHPAIRQPRLRGHRRTRHRAQRVSRRLSTRNSVCSPSCVSKAARTLWTHGEANVPTVIFEKAVESMKTRRAVPVNMADEFYLPERRASPQHHAVRRQRRVKRFSLEPDRVDLPPGATAGARRTWIKRDGRPIAALSQNAYRAYVYSPCSPPSGVSVTAESPIDHPHHNSVTIGADHFDCLFVYDGHRTERGTYNFYVNETFQGRATGRITSVSSKFRGSLTMMRSESSSISNGKAQSNGARRNAECPRKGDAGQ